MTCFKTVFYFPLCLTLVALDAGGLHNLIISFSALDKYVDPIVVEINETELLFLYAGQSCTEIWLEKEASTCYRTLFFSDVSVRLN